MEDILKIYDPANAESLTDEQRAAIGNLTPEEIKALAKAYPNGPQGNAYLVLKDKTKKDNDQLNPVSTWQNLADLHRIGQTQYVAAGFQKGFKRPEEPKTAPAQDLTKDEALNELHTSSPQTATTLGGTLEGQTGNQQGGENSQGQEATEPLEYEFDETVPLDKLNKPGLQEKYEEVLGSKPDEALTKAQLIEAIEAKQKGK